MTEDFIKEYLPAYREYKDFSKWLEWADACGFLLRVYPDEREESVAAAAIVRPLNKKQLDAAYDSFVYDEGGSVLFIDMAVAPSRDAFKALAFCIIKRFGERELVSFHNRGRKRIHSMRKARTALLN
jgi:hypothetical protein